MNRRPPRISEREPKADPGSIERESKARAGSTVQRSPFDLIDELSCYYDTPAEPNNVHLEVLVPGQVDHGPLRQAVAGALAAAPRARGRMAAGHALRFRYTWEFPPLPDIDPMSRATWSDEHELAALRTRFLASSPPLHASPPLRLLLATGPGASCLMLNAHHAAMDGMSSLELLRDIAARYHVITGNPTRARRLADVPLGSSEQGHAFSVPPGPVPSGGPPPPALVQVPVRAAIRYPVARVAHDRERRERRERLDGCGLRLLLVPTVPRLPGATVNDVLVAALIATISRWNAAHHRPPAAIRITVPVNVRGPSLRGVAGNHSRIATVTAEPRTAAGDPFSLLAAVTRQTKTLRQAGQERASAGPLGLAPGWCPVVLKRMAVRIALRVIGAIVCDTAMLTNLGNVTDPPWSGEGGPVRMALSGPARMPRGLSVAAVTADGQLQLGFRYRYALFDETAAARFTAAYAATLGEFANRTAPRNSRRCP